MRFRPTLLAAGVSLRRASLFCGVALLAGTPAAALAAGPAWLPSSALSADGHAAFQPGVAMDGNGDIVAVWSRSDGTSDIVQARERQAGPGNPFGSVQDVTGDGSDATAPRVAVDTNGEAFLVWQTSDGTVDSAYRPLGSHSAFGAPTRLSASGTTASSPQIAVDGAGDAIAVWEQADGTLQAAFSQAGSDGAFSSPVQVPTTASASDPQVAMDGTGDASVVWQQADGTVQEGYSSSDTEAFNAALQLSDPGAVASNPSVTMDFTGDTTVVWQQADGSIEDSESPADFSPSFDPAVSVSCPGYGSVPCTGGTATDPHVADDSEGDAVVAWTDSVGGIEVAVRTPSDESFGPGTSIGPSTAASSVAIDPIDGGLVSWVNAATGQVQASVVPLSGGAVVTTPLPTDPAAPTAAVLATDSNSDGVALTLAPTATSANVLAQASGYDSGAGPLLTAVQIPGSAVVGDTVAFSTAAPFDVWPADSTPLWLFGDGTSGAAGNAVTHTFTKAGTYTVTVSSQTSTGNVATTGGRIVVTAHAPSGGSSGSGSSSSGSDGGSGGPGSSGPGSGSGSKSSGSDSGSGSGSGSSGSSGSGSPGATPLLEAHETVEVARLSGTVRVKLRGARRFRVLIHAKIIPLGSTVDAAHGTVAVTIALPHGATQTADYYQGKFVIGQQQDGLALATLVGGSFKACRSGSKVIRSLSADANAEGTFGAQGRDGAAITQGARWLTEDRCDGTYFRVLSGIVTVVPARTPKHSSVLAAPHFRLTYPPAKQPEHTA